MATFLGRLAQIPSQTSRKNSQLSVAKKEKKVAKNFYEKLLRKKIVLDGVGVFFGVANYNYLFARHLKCLDKITFKNDRQNVFKKDRQKKFKKSHISPLFHYLQRSMPFELKTYCSICHLMEMVRSSDHS